MILNLYRGAPMLDAIIGRLSVDGVFQCFTLEGTTVAIPAGTYRLAVTFSNRFQRDLPEVLDVPDRTGIRIHPGNTDADTHGCILVGKARSVNAVWQSKEACDQLLERLQSAPDSLAITIADVGAEKAV